MSDRFPSESVIGFVWIMYVGKVGEELAQFRGAARRVFPVIHEPQELAQKQRLVAMERGESKRHSASNSHWSI